MKTGLFIFDTKARSLKEVCAKNGFEVSIYCCGPTVYRDAHVGNLRTFLLGDLITRTLTFSGIDSRLIQNITDVGHMADDTGLGGIDEGQGDTEDRVLAQAKTESVDALSIARKYEDNFHRDLKLLNIQKATKYPRASESIELMIEAIAKYKVEGISTTLHFFSSSLMVSSKLAVPIAFTSKVSDGISYESLTKGCAAK